MAIMSIFRSRETSLPQLRRSSATRFSRLFCRDETARLKMSERKEKGFNGGPNGVEPLCRGLGEAWVIDDISDWIIDCYDREFERTKARQC